MMHCPVEKKCGACSYIHTEYDEQLKIKRDAIRKLYPKYNVEPVMGMKDPYHYRHKIYATFAMDQKGKIKAGMYEEDSHKVVSTSDCFIQNETANRIINSICNIANDMRYTAYNEDRGTGILRHAYLRVSHQTGKVLLVIVIGSKELPGSKRFVSELVRRQPMIETVLLNWNHKKTSMILGERDKVLYGKGFITDTIDGVSFRISSRSFYQVNPVQTQKLYQTAIKLAKIEDTDVVLDACCGIGTISLLATKKAKEVIGVEINPNAIHDAKLNAKQNQITNAQFYCADSEKFMNEFNRKIDVLILDPPRAGMGEIAMKAIQRLSPERIVYVSCNPNTQVQDLKFIKKEYEIKKIIPVDMFPHTPHVETVVCLSKKNMKADDYVEIGLNTEDYYRIKEGK